MANSENKSGRPLSPHLQIYKPMLTMMMSILHRLTGAALYFGTLLLAWWFIAAASGPTYFEYVNGFFGSIFGQIILFGYTWAIIHHMLGGIRHLIWDTGQGFDLDHVEAMARITIIGSISLTVFIWVLVYASQ